ncbi:hypothetical protein HG531_012586 [Fusarium graminearum]|nr:hypothetical protein HG531_012586 [Fusarium graminearum]
MGAEPLLELLRVTLAVSSTSANLVLDGTKSTVEAAGVLVGHELLNVLNSGNIGEAAQTEVHVSVDNDGVTELSDDSIPVVLHELPLNGSANNVVSNGATQNVHVSSRDSVRRGRLVEVEGNDILLEDLGILDRAKNAKGEELAVDGLGVEPLLLEDLNSASGLLDHGSAPDSNTKRGRNRVSLRVLNPGVEALQSLLNLRRVAAGDSNADNLLSQDASEVVLTLGELPANLLDLLVNELQGEVVKGLLDGLVLSEDRLNATDGVKDLAPDKSVGLLAEALKEGQQSGGGTVTSKGKVSSGTNNGNLVLSAKLVELSAQLSKTLRGVVDTVETSGAAVELVKVLINITNGVLLAGKRQGSDTGVVLLALQTKRNPPSGGVILRLNIASRQESGLLDRDLTRLLSNSKNGVANLGDPRGSGLGVTVGVRLQVVGHTLEENLDTKVVGEHANGGATLEVADRVKDLVDIKSITNRNVDRVTGTNTVETESSLHTLVDKLSPNLPVRVQVVNSVPTDPGSKTLVEPELVPPVHGNEVTEPLVGKLVCDNIGNSVLESRVRGLLVVENLGSTVGNKTPVLHGTVSELVDSDQIGLGQRVVNVKDLGEEVNDLGGVLKSPLTLLLETTGGVDTDGNLLAVVLAISESLDVLKVTNSPGQKVAVLGRSSLLDRHVAQSNLVGRNLDVKVKGGLEVGLVEAGESSASVASLELGAEHVVPFAIVGNRSGRSTGRLVLAAVETSHFIVDDTLELDGDDSLGSDRELLVKGDGRALGLGVIVKLCGFHQLRVDEDLGVRELKFEGVYDDFFGRLGDFRVDAGKLLERAWRMRGRCKTYVTVPL